MPLSLKMLQYKKTTTFFLPAQAGAILFLFCFAIFLVAGLKTNAQTISAPGIQAVPENNAVVVKFADVSVLDLKLSKTDYKAGETVSGSFTLKNNIEQAIPNVRYKVLLMSYYKSSSTQKIYDYSILYGPVFIAGKQSKYIDFSYKIPESISGQELGIKVHAMYENELSMGWANTKINVTGGTGLATIKSANVSVGEKDFGLNEGPTIYSGQKAVLNISLKNDTANKITLTPLVDIHKRPEPDKTISSVNGKTVSIEPGEQTTVSIDLPTFDYAPQVYVGNVSFLDNNNVLRAFKRQFRYIIGGDIVTINSVSSDKSNVAEGQTFNVTVNYSGSPQDIVNGNVPGSGTYDFDIKVFNQNNKLVAQYSDKTDFNKGSSKTISARALKNALALRYEITVTKDDKILASSKSFLSSDYEQKAGKMDIRDYFSLKTLTAFLAILILILSIVYREKLLKNKKVLAIVIIILLVLVGTFLFISRARGTDYYTNVNPNDCTVTGLQYHNEGGSCFWFFDYYTITINQPSGTLSCNQSFNLEGIIEMPACGNLTNKTYIFNNPIYGQTFPTPSSFNVNSSGNFAISNLTYPTDSTSVPLYLSVLYSSDGFPYGSNSTLFQLNYLFNFLTDCVEVTPPPPTDLSVTCSGSPNSSTEPVIGQQVTWTASPTGGASTSYHYVWSGASDGGDGDTQNAYDTYSTGGTKLRHVSVVADGSVVSAGADCQVTVQPSGGGDTPWPVCDTTHYFCDSNSTSTNNQDFGNGSYTWECYNYNGVSLQTAYCSEDNPVGTDPVCGVTHYDCVSGGPAWGQYDGGTYWVWNCGSDTNSIQCIEYSPPPSPEDGVCGYAALPPTTYIYDGNPLTIHADAFDMCSPGPDPGAPIPTSVTLGATVGSTAEWTCYGIGIGSNDATCTVIRTPVPCIDSGVRVKNSFGDTVHIAGQIPGSVTSPLRIKEGNGVWGLVLVPENDACDSGVRIKTNSGIRALAKCPCP
jgi:hypothetical protein